MINTVIDGRFQIKETLARDASSDLYVAIDTETQEPVAIKVLKPSASKESNELLSRRLQEFRLLRNLTHPNAVKVIQSGLTGDNVFYVAMEFVNGQTLHDLFQASGPLPTELVSFYLDQLASVLDMIHKHGIVHRNIKPQNVMIAVDAEGNETVKLLGFVFAKVLSPDPGKASSGMTQAGVAVGTPAYMSPEQALGRKITKLADVYSVGVMLYQALTGRLPFEEKNDLQTMVAHVKKDIPRFAQKNPANEVPVSVEAVIRKAMDKTPANRHGSVGELAAELQRAIENPDDAPSELVSDSDATSAASSGGGNIGVISVVVLVAFIAVGVLIGVLMGR